MRVNIPRRDFLGLILNDLYFLQGVVKYICTVVSSR